MSVAQVKAFYNVLILDENVYQQYHNKCSLKGFFGVWNWDRTKIVNFAATAGYDFTETELEQVLFEDKE